MGLLSELGPGRVYLDANVFIYALEGYPRFMPALWGLFHSIERGDTSAATSELTLGEVLVMPIRAGDLAKQRAYLAAVKNRAELRVTPVDRSILMESAGLRAHRRIRTPDAIHAATAVREQCSTFLTNDERLGSLPSMKVVLLSEFS